MNDFRKYATKHLGMNGMVLDVKGITWEFVR